MGMTDLQQWLVPRLRSGVVGMALALTCAHATAATWHVEGASALASDRGDGTPARPLKTLGEAMQRLHAGDDVIVGDGIYRETVVVPRMTPPPGVVTTIRARESGTAVLRGSDVVTGWRADGEGWFSVEWKDRPEPAQVFVDGRPLRQVGGTVFDGYPLKPGHELAPSHASDGGIWPGRLAGDRSTLRPGDFHIDTLEHRLHMRLASALLPGSTVEVSTRPYVFLAENIVGLQLQGLVFEHANTSSLARQGAVKVYGAHNVISQVVIRYMDAIGLQFFGTDGELRDSRIEDCGQMGINAQGYRLTIAGNQVLRNNTRGFNKWWEAGGMKMIGGVGLHDTTIRDNVVAYNNGDGIWIDWMNSGIRIAGNVTAYNAGFGIHYEASQTGRIEGNASYGNTQRGIYLLESSDSVVQDNTVVANGLEGIVVADGDRSAGLPALKPRNNRVLGNTIGWNNDVELMLPYGAVQTRSDRNHFIAAVAPGVVQGWRAPTNQPARGLQSWRERSEQDAVSTETIAPVPAQLAALLQARRLVGIEALRAAVATARGFIPEKTP